MKIIHKISAFVLTFLIGIFFTFPFLRTADANKIDSKIAAAEKVNVSAFADYREEPTVFEVEDLWKNDAENFNTNLLETGELTNGKDIKAKSGKIWLGLFREKNNFVLRPKTVRIVDEWTGWTNISVKGKAKPLFLVKDLKNVNEGIVKTVFRGDTWDEVIKDEKDVKKVTELENGFNRTFRLGDKIYTLKVVEGVNEKQEPILVLLLEHEKREQIIHYFDKRLNSVGNLFWVGDLDGDGGLDFYMDYFDYEKDGYLTGLFLSSEAEEGKFVKRFEFFMTGSGC